MCFKYFTLFIIIIKISHSTLRGEQLTASLLQRIRNLENQSQNQKSVIEKLEKRLGNLTKSCINSAQFPKNCQDVMELGNHTSGIYQIQMKTENLSVVCDMDTKGGGWTVIQNRFDASQDFDLGWQKYMEGFGSTEGEFWIGLDNIHQLTGNEPNELFIDLVNKDGHRTYAHYANFGIASKREGYKLKVLSGFEGDGPNPLQNNVHMKFSTKDRDQDTSGSNCASEFGGGWWFYHCGHSLNCRYSNNSVVENTYIVQKGLRWYTIEPVILRTKMMVRPKK